MAVLVGKQAPDFTATVVTGEGELDEITLSDYQGDKYVVLFFYPKDFTFVCPTEIIAFDKRYQQFVDKGVEVIGVSTDNEFSHMAWRNTKRRDGGIGPVQYPLVADIDKGISRAYDVLVGDEEALVTNLETGEESITTVGGDVAYRASFLIDKAGLVQHQVVNNLPLGRNIDEMLRMVDALQYFEENGEVCPAGWKDGKPGMTATPDGVADYLKKNQRKL